MDQPADFDAFWAAGKEALAKLPVDAKLVPMPESSNGKVDCWHVSLQNVGPDTTGTSRFFGVLCEPKGDGPFPALLQVPGAGVRAYRGGVEMAEKGIITFQVGIHGLPVNLDPSVYEALGAGALSGLPDLQPRRARPLLLPPRLPRLRARQRLPGEPAALRRQDARASPAAARAARSRS